MDQGFRAAIELDERDQQECQGHILDEIHLAPHGLQQLRIAAVAERNRFLLAAQRAHHADANEADDCQRGGGEAGGKHWHVFTS
jgi:hypothetical protein